MVQLKSNINEMNLFTRGRFFFVFNKRRRKEMSDYKYVKAIRYRNPLLLGELLPNYIYGENNYQDFLSILDVIP